MGPNGEKGAEPEISLGLTLLHDFAASVATGHHRKA
jgi:hypothetical protein